MCVCEARHRHSAVAKRKLWKSILAKHNLLSCYIDSRKKENCRLGCNNQRRATLICVCVPRFVYENLNMWMNDIDRYLGRPQLSQFLLRVRWILIWEKEREREISNELMYINYNFFLFLPVAVFGFLSLLLILLRSAKWNGLNWTDNNYKPWKTTSTKILLYIHPPTT